LLGLLFILIRPWLKKHYGLVLFLIVSFALTYNELKDFYTPVSFDVFEYGTDSANPQAQYFLRISFATKQAFLPYEKMHVHASLFFVDSGLIRLADSSQKFGVIFEGSEFTENDINQNHISLYDKDKPLEDQRSASWPFFGEAPGSLSFHNTPTARQLYRGDAEIFYRNGADFGMILIFFHKYAKEDESIPFQTVLKSNVRIGSTADLLAKKTNNLLYILTVVNILFIIFTTFRQTI
jgi:hypothetical protein